MAKIRTLEGFDQAIDEEISWRKRELSDVWTAIQSSSGPSKVVNLRAGVVLLYAHWEGWIKNVSQLYIRYVNTMTIPYSDLSVEFLGNALKARLMEIDEASTADRHNEFARFLTSGMEEKAKLSESLIKTWSNLSSTVLIDIIRRVGVENRDIYSLRAELIDGDLVNARNTIAHGQYLAVDEESYGELRRRVLELLSIFTDDVRNAATLGHYRSQGGRRSG